MTLVKRVFIRLGVPDEHAEITVRVLIEAGRFGIGSHGLVRLRRYLDGIRRGIDDTWR